MNYSTYFFANLVNGGGGKYKEEDIKPYSYYRKPIDYSKQPFPRGRSRIHADADENVKEYVARKIVDTTIKTGGTLADAAFFLAVAQCESGFNPDAAAGTTSALGIGQITDATWDTMENWRFNSVDPKINPLDFNKNKETTFSLYSKTRLDADANIRALIELLYYIDLKCVLPLITEGIIKCENDSRKYAYAFYHDGINAKSKSSKFTKTLDYSEQNAIPKIAIYRDAVNKYAKCYVPLPFDNELIPSTPVAYYHNNETNGSGFYPVGQHNNIHTGIHLYPDFDAIKNNTAQNQMPAIKSVAPGFIVAARFTSEQTEINGKPIDSISTNLLCNNFSGFILIRHELFIKDTIYPYYNLYMHIAPPEWDNPENDPYAALPWLSTLKSLQYGFAIHSDPDSPEFGKCYKLFCKYTGHETAFIRVGTGSKEVTVFDSQKNKLFYFKEAPEYAKNAFEGLKMGKIVTFNGPFLNIVSNERVAFIGKIPKPNSKPAPLPGYIHWETFASNFGNSTIAKIIEMSTNELKLKCTDFSKETHDNNLTLDEISQMVSQLPNGDTYNQLFDKNSYTKKLKAKMSAPDDFSGAGNTSHNGNDDKLDYSYPVKLKFTDFSELKDPSDGKKYTVMIEFYNKEKVIKSSSIEICHVSELTEKVIQTPAVTDTIKVISDSFYLETDELMCATDENDFFNTITSSRWRNVNFKCKSEWLPKRISDTLKKVPKTSLPATFDSDSVKQLLGWWGWNDPAYEQNIIVDKNKGKSIFGEYLPDDGSIDCIHPVTGTWMINLLEKAELICHNTVFTTDLSSINYEPDIFTICKGTTTGKHSVLVVLKMHENFSNEKKSVVVRLIKPSSNLKYELTPAFVDGVAAFQLPSNLWGIWKLVFESNKKEYPPKQGSVTEYRCRKPTIAQIEPVQVIESGNDIFVNVVFADNILPVIDVAVVYKYTFTLKDTLPDKNSIWQKTLFFSPFSINNFDSRIADENIIDISRIDEYDKTENTLMSSHIVPGFKASELKHKVSRLLLVNMSILRIQSGMQMTPVFEKNNEDSVIIVLSDKFTNETGFNRLLEIASKNCSNTSIVMLDSKKVEVQDAKKAKSIKLSVIPGSTGSAFIFEGKILKSAVTEALLGAIQLQSGMDLHLGLDIILPQMGIHGLAHPEDINKGKICTFESVTAQSAIELSGLVITNGKSIDIIATPSFGGITTKIVGTSLEYQIELHGATKKEWTNAKPKITINSKQVKLTLSTITKKAATGNIVQPVINGSIKITADPSPITLEVSVENNKAAFFKKVIPIKPVFMSVIPKLDTGSLHINWVNLKTIKLSVYTRFFPIDKAMKFSCVESVSGSGTKTTKTTAVNCTFIYEIKSSDGIGGFVNSDTGLFCATCSGLIPGRNYTFTWESVKIDGNVTKEYHRSSDFLYAVEQPPVNTPSINMPSRGKFTLTP